MHFFSTVVLGRSHKFLFDYSQIVLLLFMNFCLISRNFGNKTVRMVWQRIYMYDCMYEIEECVHVRTMS